MKNPIQPLEKDAHGTLRFKENAMVRHLLEWAQERGHGLNEMACMGFSADDWQQMAQLIGYSLSGYSELNYVSDDAYGAARTMADEGLSEKDARIAHLEHELYMVRASLREPIARLFGVHPDDLMANVELRGRALSRTPGWAALSIEMKGGCALPPSGANTKNKWRCTLARSDTAQ